MGLYLIENEIKSSLKHNLIEKKIDLGSFGIGCFTGLIK